MRTLRAALAVLALASVHASAGLHFGLPSAVKSKVDELDAAVRAQRAAEAARAAAAETPPVPGQATTNLPGNYAGFNSLFSFHNGSIGCPGTDPLHCDLAFNINGLDADFHSVASNSGLEGWIADAGAVAGLAEVTAIPSLGHSEAVAAYVGHGYVMKLGDGSYARFFLSAFTTATSTAVVNTPAGAVLKWQYPFAPSSGPAGLWTLQVLKAGTGTGSVASSPSGLSCGSSCLAAFENGRTVTLTASPDANSIFAGWSGACAGTGTCVVQALSSMTVTATFSRLSLTVSMSGTGSGSVTSSPAGINCGAVCGADFTLNAAVTLTAVPAAGSTFAGWTGACSSTAPVCNVLMSGAKSVGAVFNAAVLTVVAQGTGQGTVTSSPAGINCGTACSQAFSTGTVVSLTAVPAAGSVFTGWGGACAGTGTCVVTMAAAATVTATFSAVRLTVVKAGNGGNGIVTASAGGLSCGTACAADYALGTVVTLSASANADSSFAGWSGAGCSGTGTCVVTMDQAKAVTASFNTYTLAVTKLLSGGGNGVVTASTGTISCGADCSQNFPLNQTVVLTASAYPGSAFMGWSGACSGTAATCTVTLNGSAAVTTVTASFAALTVTVSTASAGSGGGAGTVASSVGGISCGTACSASYSSGTLITLTATPAANSAFTGWSLGGGFPCSSSGTTCTFTVTAPVNVTATFTSHLLSASTAAVNGAGGSLATVDGRIACPVGAACAAAYAPNATATFVATARADSNFTGWTVTGASACPGTSSCTVTMGGAVSVSANFTASAVTVASTGTGTGSITSSPAGISCGANCAALFSSGTVVVLTAVASSSSAFSNWSGACSNNASTCTITLGLGISTSAVAVFNGPTLSISTTSASAGRLGTVTSSPGAISCGQITTACSQSFANNTVVNLTATLAGTSTQVTWGGAAASCGNALTCQVTLGGSQSVTAQFGP